MNVGPSQTLSSAFSGVNIVWDGLGLSNEYSGIGSYGLHLYSEFKAFGIEPRIVAFADESFSYVDPRRIISIGDKTQAAYKFKKRVLGLKPFFPNLSYGAASKIYSQMIFHGLANVNLPALSTKRQNDKFVISVHDMIPLLVAKHSAYALQMRVLLPRVLEMADWIITGSNWTKGLLAERYGVHLLEKMSALGYGVEIEKGGELPLKTFDGIMVARGEIYKRLELFKSIARAHGRFQFALVTDQNGIDILGELPANLRVFSKISTSRLTELVRASHVMVHTSLFEGWCLPVAEAVTYGLKVLYCTGSGIDEVCDAAHSKVIKMTRDQTESSWIEAFHALRLDESQVKVDARLPSWTEVAAKTLEIYKKLI